METLAIGSLSDASGNFEFSLYGKREMKEQEWRHIPKLMNL